MVKIEYTLSMPQPETHYFHVETRLRNLSAERVDLVLPVWAPGSYCVRDYARHLQDFTTTGEYWKKIDKSRWRVWTEDKKEVRVRYRIWAHDLTVRTSHLDREHAYLNGGNIFLYLDGHKKTPLEVRVKTPRGWRIATGLERKSKNVFFSPDYDTLVDSPMEIGTFHGLKFQSGGKKHYIVIDGGGNYDQKKITQDVKKIVEYTSNMMGDMPYRDYLFILHTLPNLRGGLEHRNSTSLQFPSFRFRKQEEYESFLHLATHEYFHTWNGKRIHPESLGPFDYEKEVYTSLLWVMEGVTCHYESVIPTRAKLFRPADYLRMINARIVRFLSKPGRHYQSLEESSFDTWIKLYQPSDNSANSQISYYEKGALVALILDLEIRHRTENRKSLDDVMRTLYQEYGMHGVGYPDDAFRDTCEEISGGSLKDFFWDYVKGRKEIPWNRYLGYAGLEQKERPRQGEEEKGQVVQAWTGVIPRPQGDQFHLGTVLVHSPAEKAGLSPNDEIVALNGARITSSNWADRVEDLKPGATIEITYFRLGFLRTTKMTLGQRPSLFREIQYRKRATKLQKKIYKGLVGTAYPSGS